MQCMIIVNDFNELKITTQIYTIFLKLTATPREAFEEEARLQMATETREKNIKSEHYFTNKYIIWL